MKKGRLLIVTGGNRGIGKQIALSALDAGWRVAISYGVNKKPASEMEITTNSRIKAFPLDVANDKSIEDFFVEIEREMGSADALVTAAGIDNGERSVAELDHDFVISTMKVNVVGLILCCQEFARRAMDSGRPGVIVNLSSMAATIGGRMHKTVYAASKGAVDVFTIGAANRLKDPVIKPAIEATIACGSVAETSDIANPIIDLISGNFGYASGSILNLGGGGL